MNHPWWGGRGGEELKVWYALYLPLRSLITGEDSYVHTSWLKGNHTTTQFWSSSMTVHRFAGYMEQMDLLRSGE